MRKIAIYGKGGIGKSTTTSALAAAMAKEGLKVMQIGCDPKADSSINLLGGRPIIPVMDYLRKYGKCESLSEIVIEGFGGVKCVEAGGPVPGKGCAGRGIMATFEVLEELGAFEYYKPDVVFYDVLGDVVCGGFAAPIRENYAEDIIIVISGEKMALYAADNIYRAVQGFENRGYAKVRGIILNRRNVENEREIAEQFAREHDLPILADIPRDGLIQVCENRNQTVIEGAPDSKLAGIYSELARSIIKKTYLCEQ